MRITIITVCLNAADSIEKTIRSVINQDHPDLEYIVVDGMSTDGTIDIINKYRDKISLIIREPDDGLYDAMNKGILKSSGEIINFMNAGDCFAFSDVLLNIVNTFAENPDKLIIYGDIIRDDTEKSLKKHPDLLTKCILMSFWLNQQAIFYKRSAFEIVGLFHREYRIYADYEWNLRAFLIHNLSYLHISKIICLYEGGGLSDSPSVPLFCYELRAIRKRYFCFLERIYYAFVFKTRNRLVTMNFALPVAVKDFFK